MDEAKDEIDRLLESGKKQFLSKNALKGEIDQSGHFTFTSIAKGTIFSEFIGRIAERENGIYLEGEIRPRKNKMKLLYGLVAFTTLVGITLMLSSDPLVIIFSVLFISVPYLNIWITKKGINLKASLNRLFKVK